MQCLALKKGKHGALELTLSVALINLHSMERAEKLFSLSDVVLCGTESFQPLSELLSSFQTRE